MMELRKKMLCVLILCSMCGLLALSGCGSKEETSGDKTAVDETDSVENLGEFTMEDIEGNTYTQEMFAECDLTMVNVFTTWCTPCVREIPELEKLSQEMSDKGVKVVGIVLDAAEKSESAKQDVVEKAKLLAEETGAAYPFLIPDKGYMNGRLLGVDAVPETFFVDTDGNIVGEAYVGAHSLGDWKVIVEKELEGVKK